MADAGVLGAVPASLDAELRADDVDAVLALVDQELDGDLEGPMWVTVPDVGRVVEALVDREHGAGLAAKAVSHRRAAGELADSLLDGRESFGAGEFDHRLRAHLESMRLLAEIGEIDRAAELLNVASGYLRPLDTDLEPHLRGYAAELMWTAADAFAVNEWFFVSLDHYEAVARDGGDEGDDVHAMIAERCLGLISNGTDPVDDLVARAGRALQGIGAGRRDRPEVMGLRFELARHTGDRTELAAVAALGSGCAERSRIIAGLMARLPDPAGWRSEFGPFAPFIYAECTGATHHEAMELFALPLPGEITDDHVLPGTAAVRIGDLTIAEPGCDPSAAVLGQWIHAVPADDHLTTTTEGRRPRRRSVPTAAMQTILATMDRSGCPAGVHDMIRAGRAAAVATTAAQIDAALDFLDGGDESEATYPCAGLLVGIVAPIVGERRLPAYVDHLELAESHVQAVDRCCRDVALVPRT